MHFSLGTYSGKSSPRQQKILSRQSPLGRGACFFHLLSRVPEVGDNFCKCRVRIAAVTAAAALDVVAAVRNRPPPHLFHSGDRLAILDRGQAPIDDVLSVVSQFGTSFDVLRLKEGTHRIHVGVAVCCHCCPSVRLSVFSGILESSNLRKFEIPKNSKLDYSFLSVSQEFLWKTTKRTPTVESTDRVRSAYAVLKWITLGMY